MTTHLPLLTTRVRSQDDGFDETALVRQWRLLKLLASTPKGFTFKELVALLGVSENTIRRDILLLKEVGFHVSERVGEFGRKSWRVCRLPESIGGNGATRESYCLIRDALQDLQDVAIMLGDSPLAESLKRLREWVEGKCQSRKPKPR
jgi:biotin operon repressor